MSSTPEIPSKEWISKPRVSKEYIQGVVSFAAYLRQNIQILGGDDCYYCPCVNCRNMARGRKKLDIVAEHLILDGISTSYTTWIYHGEHWVGNRVMVCGKEKKGRVQGMQASRTALRHLDPTQSQLDVVDSQLFNVTQQMQTMTEKINSMTQLLVGQSSQFEVGSSSQVRLKSPIPEKQAGITPSPFPIPRTHEHRRCYLKNLRLNKTYASGFLVETEVPDPDYFEVCIKEIFDTTAELMDRDLPEGTFADVDIDQMNFTTYHMVPSNEDES